MTTISQFLVDPRKSPGHMELCAVLEGGMVMRMMSQRAVKMVSNDPEDT